ncbi:MAG: hypothetical protein V2J24_07230 [Pseudomonadales bacterium]|nr:hypothetical protein [Pseudomonadales bacterium]
MASDTDDDEFDAVIDDGFDDEGVDNDDAESISAVVAPSRLLAVRRAIEARREAREMDAALNYLELDFEDEE